MMRASDVHRDAVDVAVGQLHRAGVQAGANLKTEILQLIARGAIEHRESAVAGELHDDTTRAGHVPLSEAVVGSEAAVHASSPSCRRVRSIRRCP